MPRLVQRHLAPTGNLERSGEPPPLLGNLTCELDAFALQIRGGRVEVVAHQVELMVSTLVGRVARKLCGRKREDEQTSTRIERVESERVAEEHTSTLCVVSKDDGVNAGDH